MDQAQKLRMMMGSIKNKNEKREENKRAQILSVSSGKGGVGKTNFTVNLSISLSRQGYKVLILDADVGLGNVEIIAGINNKYKISDLLYDKISVEDIIGTGPENIDIISGGTGLNELSSLNEKGIGKVLSAIEELYNNYDYIIIDTGAGISDIVLDFIKLSDEVIVVSTPDPTSIMDSYILIKSLDMTGYSGRINLVSNLVKNASEGKDVFYKINNASQTFLKLDIRYLGYILKDIKVNEAVRNQIPFVISNPNRTISKQVKDISKNLVLNIDNVEEKKLSFKERILNVFLN